MFLTQLTITGADALITPRPRKHLKGKCLPFHYQKTKGDLHGRVSLKMADTVYLRYGEEYHLVDGRNPN